jgi:RHS repeat-associated protein
MVVDQTGSLSGVKRHDYLSFGEEIYAGTGGRTQAQGYVSNADGNRKRWAQLERDDETGLDYAEARYYSNVQGRFTSVDPENYQAMRDLNDPQSWNAYAYVNNNPLSRNDPDGKGFSEKLRNAWNGWGWRSNEEVQQLEVKWRNWLRDREKEYGTLVNCQSESQCQRVNVNTLSRNEVFHYAADLKYAIQSGTLRTYSKEQIDQMAGLGNAISQAAPAIAGSVTTVGKNLKNLRDIGGRLKGYTRGNTELTGGDQAARDTFRQLTGRDPAGTFDRVIQEGKEILYRASSKSGPSKIEIVDHAQKFLEKISFK